MTRIRTSVSPNPSGSGAAAFAAGSEQSGSPLRIISQGDMPRMADLETLIDRWLGGDQRAAEALYDLHRERTFRLAYGLLGDRRDAEEAAQDALAYALRNIRRFDPKRSRFTTWLYMITVSRCRDRLRKRRSQTLPLPGWLWRARHARDPQPGPENRVEMQQTRSAIWRAVQALSPVLREAIVLRHWGGHTYQEIAEITGCPMKTAQSRVRLAHQQLARSISEKEFGLIPEEIG